MCAGFGSDVFPSTRGAALIGYEVHGWGRNILHESTGLVLQVVDREVVTLATDRGFQSTELVLEGSESSAHLCDTGCPGTGSHP